MTILLSIVKKLPVRFSFFVPVLFSVITYAQAPVINSFSPTTATAGSSLTINGTNFNSTAASNIVFFGATAAAVTAASATQLTVTVPYGATYGSITVLNTSNNLIANSPLPFSLLSHATGTLNTSAFSSASSVGTTTSATGAFLIAGDIDGDGKADIISNNCVSGGYTQACSIFRNTSSAGVIGYASPVYLPIPNNGASGRLSTVTMADMNGDGKLDIIGGEAYGFVYVYINTSTVGSISFSPSVAINISSAFPASIKAVDFDNDGKNDIVVGTSGSFSLIRNTGTAGGNYTQLSFGTPSSLSNGGGVTYSTDVVDFDGDGKIDIGGAGGTTTSSMFHAARNTSVSPAVSFAAPGNYSNTYYIFGGRAVDIDGDGKVDYAGSSYAASSIDYVSVWKNNSSSGTINFGAAVNFARTTGGSTSGYELDAGDLNGDGRPDLVSADFNTGFSVLPNTATSGTIDASSLGTAQVFALSGADATVITDADNDGKNDLIVITNSTLYSFKNVLTGALLPVNIISFKATCETSGTVALAWQTASEQNNKGFDIERMTISSSNSAWQKIGFVQGAINSSVPLSYNYEDRLNVYGKYAYRLKQYDLDNAFTYSSVVTVDYSTNSAASANVFPNPVIQNAILSVTLNQPASIIVNITDAAGKLVQSISQKSVPAGNYQQQLHLSAYVKGIYFCQVKVTGAGSAQLLNKTIRLSVTK